MKSRWEELLAMILIGDGALNLMHPRRHSAIWNCGPASYRKAAHKLQEYPLATRGLGVALIAFGLWVATKAVKA
jgi:hypothetical protein